MVMRIVLKLRRNPKKIQEFLENLDLEKNMKVLDYGCGIGSYSIEAAKIVGQSGSCLREKTGDLILEKYECKRIFFDITKQDDE